MGEAGRIEEAARFMWQAHQRREPYRNLPPEIRPQTLADAYAAQEVFHDLARPTHGPVAGLKIATTTKVMQDLMGIDHPCGGVIFANTVHPTPARLACADFVNLRLECEIAFRLGADLPPRKDPYTAENVRDAVAALMPAFELIEDRNAVYRETDAYSMIVDNCWNAGVVLGAPVGMRPDIDPGRLHGRLEINGRPVSEGDADDPLGALAWLANLVAARGRPIRRDMVVITGSLVATVSVAPGDTAVFTVDGLGSVRLELR
ncbi:MAG TPA: fumarylacetoacetate hydrolase family protein [Alphaproteobacteria bacterium]